MLSIRDINGHITLGQLDLAAFAKEKGIGLKREIERAGTRFLLKELLKTEAFELCYTSFNKPFLGGREEHLSISHSHDKLVIIINRKESTGIDIELIRDKVINIQHKFLHTLELPYAENNVDKLITVWAAKEAVFKACGKNELEFAKHICVRDTANAEIRVEITMDDFERNYLLKVETLDNYRMTYILHEL